MEKIFLAVFCMALPMQLIAQEEKMTNAEINQWKESFNNPNPIVQDTATQAAINSDSEEKEAGERLMGQYAESKKRNAADKARQQKYGKMIVLKGTVSTTNITNNPVSSVTAKLTIKNPGAKPSIELEVRNLQKTRTTYLISHLLAWPEISII